MNKEEKINEILSMKRSSDKFFKAMILARNFHRETKKTIDNANSLASDGVSPLIQSEVVDELFVILSKINALYQDLETNHKEIVNWKIPKNLHY